MEAAECLCGMKLSLRRPLRQIKGATQRGNIRRVCGRRFSLLFHTIMNQPLVPPAQLEAVAERFTLLGAPARLDLLNALHEHGEMTVGDLVEITGHRQASVSKHLTRMADGGLLHRRREGLHVYYAIADQTLGALCLLVCTQLRDEAGGETTE